MEARVVHVLALPVGFNDVAKDGVKKEQGTLFQVWAWAR